MSKRVFVSNLDRNVSASDLRQIFGAFGEVKSVGLVRDPSTHGSGGCAYVEMVAPECAAASVSQLCGREIAGRQLKVKLCERIQSPRRDRTGTAAPATIAAQRWQARAAAERLFSLPH